jgi:hypothetical protein
MKLKKTLKLFYWINDYIICKYSISDSKSDGWVLNTSYINDLSKFNNIIGRLEIYINVIVDKENAVYMIEWFEREMESRDYMFDDFMDWAEEQEKLSTENNG